MTLWLVLAACALVTFATRLSFIAAEGRFAVPAWFRSMLPFVPIATLTALVAPGLAPTGGACELSARSGRLAAGGVAIVVAAATRNPLLTIGAGFGVLWLAS